MIGELLVASAIGLYAMRNVPGDIGHAVRGEASEAEKRAAARDEAKQEKLRQRRDRINLAREKWEDKKRREQERKERQESRRQARQRRRENQEEGNGPGPLFTWGWSIVRDGAVDAHRAHVRNRAARQGKQELRDKGVLGPTGFQKFRANLHATADAGWERTNRRLFGEKSPPPGLTLNPVLLLPPLRRRPELTFNATLPLPAPPTGGPSNGGEDAPTRGPDPEPTPTPTPLPVDGDSPDAGEVLEGEVVIDGEPVVVPDEQPAPHPLEPQVVHVPASRADYDITAPLEGGPQRPKTQFPPPSKFPATHPSGTSTRGPVVDPPPSHGTDHGSRGSNGPGFTGGARVAATDLAIDTRSSNESKEEQGMAKTGGSLVKANKGFSGKMAKPAAGGGVAKMPEVQDFGDSVAFANQLGEVVRRAKKVAGSFTFSLKKNDAGRGKLARRVLKISEELDSLETNVTNLKSELRELIALQEQYEQDTNRPGKGFFVRKKSRS